MPGFGEVNNYSEKAKKAFSEKKHILLIDD